MNYREYVEIVRNIEVSDELKFRLAIAWLHPDRLPLSLVSLGNTNLKVIKVPAMTKNQYGKVVPVIAIAAEAFSGNDQVTDIILPSGIGNLPARAFSGCKNLKNVTIPKSITSIREGTFDGCENLENIYYEGTMADWRKVNIVHEKHEIELGPVMPGTPVHEILAEKMVHIPGNDAVFAATIHFGCNLESAGNSSFSIVMDGKDITRLFYTL